MRGIWIVLAMWALSGCAPYVGADVVTLNSTKKTIADHVVSNATGEDCSTVKWSQGENYCQAKVVVQRPPVYCQKTLGDVECHDTPDPYRNGAVALASPPPVRVETRDKGWFDD